MTIERVPPLYLVNFLEILIHPPFLPALFIVWEPAGIPLRQLAEGG